MKITTKYSGICEEKLQYTRILFCTALENEHRCKFEEKNVNDVIRYSKKKSFFSVKKPYLRPI